MLPLPAFFLRSFAMGLARGRPAPAERNTLRGRGWCVFGKPVVNASYGCRRRRAVARW